ERGEVIRGAPERIEGDAPGLVGQRDGDLRAAGERLQERPLRSRQVLEAVREDRAPVPRVELGLEAFGRVAALEVAVPELEPVELGAIGGVEPGQIAVEISRIDEPRLQLAESSRQGVGKAGESRGGPEAV